MALRAHLRLHIHFFGDFGHLAGFINRARQRLLAVNMLTEFHRVNRNDGVIVIGYGDDDGFEVFLGLEHLAPIFISLGVGIFFKTVGGALVIDIAHGDEVLAFAAFDILRAAPARANDADVDLIDARGDAKGGLVLRESSGGHHRGRAGHELTTRELI